MNTVEIYVQLLEEGTDVMRPTQALDFEDGTYKVLPTHDYAPEDEIWEFVPGTIVKCQEFSEKRDGKRWNYLLAMNEA